MMKNLTRYATLILLLRLEHILTLPQNLVHPKAAPGFGYVSYEVHLHPTYRVPCLWFSLHDLPPDEPAFNIDTVFRRLIPDAYKDGLRRGVGGIGGISADVSLHLALPLASPNHWGTLFLSSSVPVGRRYIQL